MPAGNPPVRPYPGKPFRTYGDAAEAGQLVTIRCGLCRNKRHYFAADLAEAYEGSAGQLGVWSQGEFFELGPAA